MPEISVRERLPRDVAWLLAPVTLWITVLFVREYGWAVDSRAYWGSWTAGLYDQPPGHEGAFLYSPAFAQLIWPITKLPEDTFICLFAGATLAVLVLLTRPLAWGWRIPLLVGCSFELATGNINWLLAVVAAYGLRLPGLWVIPALTKITPCVGPVWFLVRGEWRQLATSLIYIVGVAGTSYLLAPDLWAEWWSFLRDNQGLSSGSLGGSLLPPPIVRVPLALALVTYGARAGRTWVIPASMILASPVFGLGSLAILAGLARLEHVRTSPPPVESRLAKMPR